VILSVLHHRQNPSDSTCKNVRKITNRNRQHEIDVTQFVSFIRNNQKIWMRSIYGALFQ
jgi:hypothetical protein